MYYHHWSINLINFRRIYCTNNRYQVPCFSHLYRLFLISSISSFSQLLLIKGRLSEPPPKRLRSGDSLPLCLQAPPEPGRHIVGKLHVLVRCIWSYMCVDTIRVGSLRVSKNVPNCKTGRMVVDIDPNTIWKWGKKVQAIWLAKLARKKYHSPYRWGFWDASFNLSYLYKYILFNYYSCGCV